MSNLVIASNEADAAAAEAVEQHHAELAAGLAATVERLLAATDRSDADAVSVARDTVVAFCRQELLPHADSEERVLYPAARALEPGRLLVEAMVTEHRTINNLVEEIARAEDPVRAAAAARALEVLFSSHLTKENELLVPMLVAAPGISVAALLTTMHRHASGSAAGARTANEEPGCGGHGCTCGELDEDEPELDARIIPHAIRHASIFGALDTLAPGRALVLVASHDPRPLLAQLEQRSVAQAEAGQFLVEYVERGPEVWRLRFRRTTGAAAPIQG